MNPSTLKGLPALALGMLLAGCGGQSLIQAEDPPPVDGQSLGNATVTRHWQADLGTTTPAGYRLSPALHDGRVFAASAEGTVRAFEVEDGERVWAADLDTPVTGAVGAGDAGVAVGSADGEVILLDPDDGSVRWRQRLSSEILAPPAVGQGSVVVRTGDGGVFAVDADSGEQRWLYRRSVPALSLRGHSAPVLVNNGVVAGFDNGRLTALELDSGDAAWEATVAVPEGRSDLERMVDLDADPVVAGGDVFAGAYQGRLAGIALADGRIAWTRDVSVLGGVSADADNVYASDSDGWVWAFDRRNGASLWRFEALEGVTLSAPRRYRGDLIVAGSDGYISRIAPGDGELLSRHRIGNARLSTAPVIAGDRLIQLDRKGRLHVMTINQNQ